MVRLFPNARLEPTGDPAPTGPSIGAIARRGPDRPLPADPAVALAGSALVLALIPLAGCANFVSPLSQWRAAYDGNLFRKLSPEEMADASGPADSTNLFQRWLTPKEQSHALVAQSPGLVPGPRLRRLAAHGQARPRTPRPTPSSRPRSSCSSRGSSRRPRSSSPRSPRTASRAPGARTPSSTWPSASTSARITSRPTTATRSSTPTTPRRPTRRSSPAANTRSRRSGWRSPIPRRPQRRSCHGRAVRRPAARHRHRGLGPQGTRTRASTTTRTARSPTGPPSRSPTTT